MKGLRQIDREYEVSDKFPSFKLERLSQAYSRIDESTYRYQSGGGQFTADLKVDRVGFVRNYPSIWEAEE